MSGSVNVGSFPREKKREKTINILNQFLSENPAPPEPTGGLFRCKILHKDRMRVRYQELVIEKQRGERKTDRWRKTKRERENMPTNNSGKWMTVQPCGHKEINEKKKKCIWKDC